MQLCQTHGLISADQEIAENAASIGLSGLGGHHIALTWGGEGSVKRSPIA